MSHGPDVSTGGVAIRPGTDASRGALCILVLAATRFEGRAWARLRMHASGRVHVAVTGIGPDRALRGARSAIRTYQPDWVVGTGLCGALTTDAMRGELALPSRVIDAQSMDGLTVQPLPGTATEGAMVSVPKVAATLEGKSALYAATAARWVDMESYSWGVAAAEQNVPFTVVRVVLDTAGDVLPHLAHPKTWWAVASLPGQALAARRRLAEVGRWVLCGRT
ncbi:MAG: hypothetical protein K6T63_01155 [Alicyclobacillus herbarius]|uniref:phosphorylase family protein n=1 Tax=Alicyclobacillus herbarius TaxID=122960 RepID=UPI00047C8EA9|nr:hypothetical protein [Alicyclobacillus herbarius]MCL6631214.1 hypothetical protein [Alicyclobacillus herbarius]